MARHTGNPEQLKRVFERVRAEWAVPAEPVNNASTPSYFGLVLDTPRALWDRTFGVRMTGYLLGAKWLAEGAPYAGLWASIVNVACNGGLAAAPLPGA